MNTSFVKRPEVLSAHLGTFGFDAIVHKAQSSPKKADSASQRIDALLDKLTSCEEGHASSGVLRIVLGSLTGAQFILAEETVEALRGKQGEFEARYGGYVPPRKNDSILEDLYGTAKRVEYIMGKASPFDHVVRALLPEFNETALKAFRSFSGLHNDLGQLEALCTIMDQQDIPLTMENVKLQLKALHRMETVQGLINFYRQNYLDNAPLIRAVHNHPDKMNALIKMALSRGSVEAADEIFAAAPAISEGAL